MNIGQEWVDRACWIYESDGTVLPSLWASGDRKMIIAIPRSAEAMSSAWETQAVLLSLMAQTVEALAVGTVHEVWTKAFEPEEDPGEMTAGDLRNIADLDPTVRTSLMGTWGDLKTGEVRTEMASVCVGDRGEISWEWGTSTEMAGALVDMIESVLAHDQYHAEDPEDALEQVADSMQWSVFVWEE